MPYINRLKNGVGEKDFTCFIPKNSSVIVLPQDFRINDNMVSEAQKADNLRLVYHPNVYTIRLDDDGVPALYDISNKKQENPRTMASYLPQKGIVFHGYMLCIDNRLKDAINSSQDKSYKKKMIGGISGFVQWFQKINQEDMLLTAAHELQHVDNALLVEEVKKENLRQNLPEMQLTAQQYAETRMADECSATTKELLLCIENYAENQNWKTFPERFAPFVSELQKLSTVQQRKLLNNEEYILNKSIEMWSKNPRNHSYLGEKGDFVQQTNNYADNINPLNVNAGNNQYKKIISGYFKFSVNGKNVDLSKYIKNQFKVPPHVYQDAEEHILSQKQKFICNKLTNKRSA